MTAATRQHVGSNPPPSVENDDNEIDDESGGGIQLVAHPPFVSAAFTRLDPDRFDRIRLYAKKKRNGSKGSSIDPNSDEGPAVVDAEHRRGGEGSSSSPFHEDVEPRYTVTVVDRGHPDAQSSSTSIQHNTVAFLVPAGREAEFMFGTKKGLVAVLESAHCHRLLAISTGRSHSYTGGSVQIQQELQTICQILHYRGRPYTNTSRTATSSKSRPGRGGGGRGGGTRFPRSAPEDENEDGPQPAQQQQIPFVTTSEGVGERDIVARGTSEFSGEYVVEQVRVSGGDEDGDDESNGASVVTARRLYFLSNPFVIQSEVWYRNQVLDPTRVAFEYHRAMVACLAAAVAAAPRPQDSDRVAINVAGDGTNHLRQPQGLLLGLGGGGLLHYAHRVLPHFRWVAVELDPEVARVSTRHFGLDDLVRSGYVDVRIANGLSVRCRRTPGGGGGGGDNDDDDDDDDDVNEPEEPVEISTPVSCHDDETSRTVELKAGSLAFVVVDVDSKDNTLGMSCPPPEFLKEEYLQTLAELLAPPCYDVQGGPHRGSGVLVVNVSARDAALLDRACQSIRSVFPHVFTLSPDDDSINVVVLASQHELPFLGPSAATTTSDASRVSASAVPLQLDVADGADLCRLVEELRVWEPRINSASEMIASPTSATDDPRPRKKCNKKKGGKKRR